MFLPSSFNLRGQLLPASGLNNAERALQLKLQDSARCDAYEKALARYVPVVIHIFLLKIIPPQSRVVPLLTKLVSTARVLFASSVLLWNL